MTERRVVRRYAAALFRAASQGGVVDRVESDLGLVSYTFEMSPALMDALSSPLVFPERKHAIVDDIFADKVHQITLSYLHLLVAKRREEAVARTEEEYLRLANEARGIIAVQVTTVVPITEAEESRLKSKLARLTGKSTRLEQRISPEIIGGMVVRIGDRVIDGSVRGYLEALRERLVG